MQVVSRKILILICALSMWHCGGPQDKINRFYNYGMSLYKRGEIVKAGAQFKFTLQIDPDFSEGLFMLALVELRQHNWMEAYQLLNRVAIQQPSIIDIDAVMETFTMGPVIPIENMDSKHKAGLLKVVSTLTKLTGKNPREILGNIINELGDTRNDMWELSKIALADVSRKAEDYSSAIFLLKQVLSVEPEYELVIGMLCDLYLEIDDLENATVYAEKLGRMSIMSPQAQYKRGQVAVSLGKVEEALRLFEDALALDSNFHPALFQILLLIKKERGVEAAITRCEKQIGENPDNAANYAFKGYLLLSLGDARAAKTVLEKALLFDSEDIDVKFMLDQIHAIEVE